MCEKHCASCENTANKITQKFIREFAELNLEITKTKPTSPALLSELRENARLLMDLTRFQAW